ncbi:MAG: peptide-methionine (S)-S-oxide reductase [Thiotrichales bacterium]|nr:MAG: peptide-methionine (S)-S-oxide reductase [Thiotrichales bacterium]
MIHRKLFYSILAAAITSLVAIFPATAASPPSQNSAMEDSNHQQTATFAGGCFWCVESDFDKVPGVTETISGYIDGHLINPTYKQVSSGISGHTEAVEITFDNRQISYEELLEIFWRSIDPTTSDRQFCDRGTQYRSGIYYHNNQQREAATRSKTALEKNKPFKEAIVTEVKMASIFYPAEAYHQDYHNKNPVRYNYYRYGCGRDKRVEALWGSKAS